jgi:hypothetical protein
MMGVAMRWKTALRLIDGMVERVNTWAAKGRCSAGANRSRGVRMRSKLRRTGCIEAGAAGRDSDPFAAFAVNLQRSGVGAGFCVVGKV